MTIIDSTFEQNSANFFGGGAISLGASCRVNMVSSNMSRNEVVGRGSGGAVFITGGTSPSELHLTSSILSHNSNVNKPVGEAGAGAIYNLGILRVEGTSQVFRENNPPQACGAGEFGLASRSHCSQ